MKRKEKSPVIFHCPQMENLAKAVITRSGVYALAKGIIDWNIFPDGSLDAVIGGREKRSGYIASMVRGRDVVFLASFDSPADIQNQMLVIYQLARHEAHSLKIILPYFPGTMDREDQEGRVVNAVGYMDQLANIPLQRGPAIVITFDLHVPHELFYLGHNARCRALSALPLLKGQRALLLSQENHTAVAFPDDGAYKRFAHLMEPLHKIICYKKRNRDARKVVIVEGDPKDQHVIIVDDIIMTGATMLECKNVLLEAGAASVSLFASHGIFPQESWKKFIDAGFKHIWITDSCPESAGAVRGQKPFEVLSLASLIAHAITE
ncbi:MAG: ribose-phosphate pyrophosphokinase-like domain-containing protein [Candidatus Sungbacteria bacterium]|nr:ribose-phosphate pyrophosphokinase-like domain-containing protein [Candidatus Sungbacteria bacterium]